jgi:hypothetical protein
MRRASLAVGDFATELLQYGVFGNFNLSDPNFPKKPTFRSDARTDSSNQSTRVDKES